MSAEFAGALDQRVAVLRRASGRDDLGGASGGWDLVASLWAGLAPIAPAAWGEGDRPAARPRWRATIRAGADVLAGDRLEWRGRALLVRTVEADPATADRLTLVLEEDR